jgi:hypothetical protein
MVYVIPANFLFGRRSNRIREMLFPPYRLRRSVLLRGGYSRRRDERDGLFFERKPSPERLPST